MKALVLGVQRFNFTDTTSGQVISGVKISYLDLESPVAVTDNYKGIQDMEISARDLNVFNDFNIVPAVYDLNYDIVPGARGKAVVRYKSAKFVKDYKFIA